MQSFAEAAKIKVEIESELLMYHYRDVYGTANGVSKLCKVSQNCKLSGKSNGIEA